MKDSANTLSCYAPSASMRFNHSGKVLACCFNRGYILGTFPEQSIHEIWFGEKASHLRNAIAVNDFSLGCQDCGNYISCGNRQASGAHQYDYLPNYGLEKTFPTMLDFELGSTCNFECVMCSGEYSTAIRANREKKKKYYSPYEAFPDAFIEQLIPFIPHLKEMRFVGGEPFLMKVYYQIWDEVIKAGSDLTMNVLTNASILNQRVKELVEKGNFKISVSIDSLVKETFENIRKNSDFDLVMSNVQYFTELMKQKQHVMNFNLCVMRQNWKEIPDYFRYCNEHNIKVVQHTVKFPTHSSLWNLPPSDLEEILSFYRNQHFIQHSEISQENTYTFNGIVHQIENWLLKARQHVFVEDLKQGELLQVVLENLKSDETETTQKFQSMLLQLLESFNTEEKLIILKILRKLPPHMLVSELSVSSMERMLVRFQVMAENKTYGI